MPVFFVINDYMELSCLSTYLQLICECSQTKFQTIHAVFLVLYRSFCLCDTHTHTHTHTHIVHLKGAHAIGCVTWLFMTHSW